jgi:hypothetical protein
MKTGQLAVALLISSPLMTGCQGAMWGNVAVLLFTVGIFLGTITLGRPRD